MQPSGESTTASLEHLQQQAWAILQTDSQKPGDVFYTGTLGTQSGSGVSLRTVVVREVNPLEKTIICYSDKRASKIQEIEINPSVSFLFWDSERKIQLRLSGTATIHTTSELTNQHWAQTSPSNRRSYLAIPAPGSSQSEPTSGLPDGLDTREPTQDESEQGRSNFAVIVSRIQQLDWLHLAKSGHRRAIFQYEAGELVDASWIIP
jgi:pyridoxine/pyridoxamine 5'-phosphate oxidase